MPLVCAICGNKKRFKREGERVIEKRRREEIIEIVDEEEDVEDTEFGDVLDDEDDEEEVERDTSDSSLECVECESTDLIDLTDSDHEQWADDVPANEQEGFNNEMGTFDDTNSKKRKEGKIDELKKDIMEG